MTKLQKAMTCIINVSHYYVPDFTLLSISLQSVLKIITILTAIVFIK